jgi:imidazolonepropionase-like amidohydrolase
VFISVPLWLILSSADGALAADLLIQNVRLIDGTGAAPRTGASILIRGGRIAEIGAAITAAGVPTLDADGATVISGLIDAHVHNAVVPGSAFHLVVVDGDPLRDVRALRKIRWTVKDGVARTPAEWMGVGSLPSNL